MQVKRKRGKEKASKEERRRVGKEKRRKDKAEN